MTVEAPARMSNRGLATGVFRAWGLMWSINALLALPQFLNALIRGPYGLEQKATERYFLSTQAIGLGCGIAVAAFLIVKASWLAEIVFSVEGEVEISVDERGLRDVLFAAVGLYFLLDGFRNAVGSGYQLLRLRGDDQVAKAYLLQRAPESLARSLGGLLAGAIVLLGRGRNPWQLAKALYGRIFSLRGSPSGTSETGGPSGPDNPGPSDT